MHLARVLPKLGAFPELHTFRCLSCGEVDTRDASAAVSGRAELGTEAPQ